MLARTLAAVPGSFSDVSRRIDLDCNAARQGLVEKSSSIQSRKLKLPTSSGFANLVSRQHPAALKIVARRVEHASQ